MEAIYSVPKDRKGQEILKRGTALFPCSVYDRDARQYVAGEITPHWHPEMEIFLLVEGNAHITFLDEEFDLRPGEGFFANSGVIHGVSNPGRGVCHYHSMVFDAAILSGVSGSAYEILYLRPFMEQGVPYQVFRPDDCRQQKMIAELFSNAFDTCKDEADGYEFLVRNLLSQIFLILKRYSGNVRDRRSSQQELRMKQMLSWLDEHYMEMITVAQLAEVAGICIRECQRSFSNILHMSPMQYLNRRRITVAAEFLISTDMSISEIGLCCGFDNPSYFARQFKRITGMTPKTYRKNNTIREIPAVDLSDF